MNGLSYSSAANPSVADVTPSQVKAQRVGEAYLEYCEQCDAGQDVRPEEFCARFPSLQSSLGRLLQAHHFFQEHLESDEEKRRAAWPCEGEAFLGFQLKRELGKGAFARVFLAREVDIGNRLVVVKIARRGGAAEAKILGSVQHPHVVPIHSIQQDPESAFSVACMPYVGVATLHDVFDLLKQQTPQTVAARIFLDASADLEMPVESAHAPSSIFKHGAYVEGVRYVGWKLAQALAHIHKEGVCHLDLKPSNVLIRPDGEPVLLDFNLSSDTRRDHQVAGGTLPYMAPEHLRHVIGGGDKELVGPHSDVFSFGILLYELATGVHPFGPIPLKATTGELAKLMQERQARGFKPVRKLNPDVEADLATLIEKCLHIDPEERPKSAADAAAELQRQLRLFSRTRRSIQRHPILVALGLVLSLLAISAAATPIMMAPSASERHFQAGADAYRNGKYSEALLHFNSAITADGENQRAVFARGRTYQKLGRADDKQLHMAISDFARLRTLVPPGISDAAMGFSYQSLKTPLHGPAMEMYKKAVERGYVTAAILNNMGLASHLTNHRDDARRYLDESIRFGPQYQAAFHNRGHMLLNVAGNLVATPKSPVFAEAVRTGMTDFDKALTMEPVSGDLLVHTATMYAVASWADPKWKPAAIQHLKSAILSHGYKLDAKDFLFQPLEKEIAFQDLKSIKAPSRPITRAIRIVDPILDDGF